MSASAFYCQCFNCEFFGEAPSSPVAVGDRANPVSLSFMHLYVVEGLEAFCLDAEYDSVSCVLIRWLAVIHAKISLQVGCVDQTTPGPLRNFS